uniref:ABC transporter domain-containing protein n=1 Tax=Tetranychus urticae TaxID=32264 RepID=T1JTR1_TETUR
MARSETYKSGRNRINQQVKIMLWKSLIVRRNHISELLCEFLIPLTISIIFVIVLIRLGSLPSSTTSRVPAQTFPDPSFNFDPSIFGFSNILYAPNDEKTVNRMTMIEKKLSMTGIRPTFANFSTSEDLYSEYLKMIAIDPNALIFGVLFDQEKANNPAFTYTIRSRMPHWLKTTFCVKTNSYPCVEAPYNTFSNLQTLVNLAYLTEKFPEIELDMTKVLSSGLVKGYRFPYPSHTTASDNLSDLTPWVLVFGFIISYVFIIKRITSEKSNQIREMYRITGLMDWIYWFAHLADHYAIFLVQALIVTGLFTMKIINGNACVFNYSSYSLVFFITALWGLNFTLSALALSIPFNRPISAVVFGALFWTLQIVPAYYIDPATNPLVDVIETRELRFISCFLPNMALTLAIRVIQQKEIYGYGATWSNLFEPASVFGELSLGIIIIILFVTSLMYIPLIYYLEKVIPSQYGISKPWLFPLHALFRYKTNKKTKREEPLDWDHDNFEPLAPSDEVKISIRKVLKEFDTSNPPSIAVNNVSLDIPHHQITMLLGENGAGKTTLMSIIIGLIPPTSGSVIIDGHDILEETADARRNLSFCPQANVLQPELSVENHLMLYGAIKGVPMSKLSDEVTRIVEDIKLNNFRHLKPNSLSGGMRRRLNLGIALIGDSEIIILDEPTAGLDPGSRRDVWNILNEIKSRKTVIMTTHFIEEADAIGERVAIMRKGKLACFGSPMYLKRLFGTGYELRVAKSEESSVQDLTAIMQTHFPGAKNTYAVEGEVIYSLPQEHANSNVFHIFFQDLEERKDELKISSWGLSYTTLEEVFIRVVDTEVAQLNHTGSQLFKSNNQLNSDATNSLPAQTNSEQMSAKDYLHPTIFFVAGLCLFFLRIKALLIKRFNYSKRYWKIILFQIFIPTVLFAVIMLLDQKIVGMVTLFKQTVQLSLQHLYGSTNALYSNPSGDATIFGEKFGEVLSAEYAKITYLNSTTSVDDYMLKLGDLLQPIISTAVRPHLWSLLVQITMPFLAASHILVPIHERSSKAKLLQIMTGLHPIMYWISHFIFDMMIHIICTLCIFTVVLTLDFQLIFHNDLNIQMAFLLSLITSGVASIPLAYVFSFLFDRPSIGYSFLVLLFLVFGVMTAIINFIIESLVPKIVSHSFKQIFDIIVAFFPLHAMTMAIVKAFSIALESKVCSQVMPKLLEVQCVNATYSETDMTYRCCPKICEKTDDCFEYRDALSWKYGVLPRLLQLIGEAAIFSMVLLILEIYYDRLEWVNDIKEVLLTKLSFHTSYADEDPRRRNIESEDSDVTAERHRVYSERNGASPDQDILSVIDLKKQYRKFRAVEGLTFGVRQNECFGLLGINGAGKSTTFKMLVGDIRPTSGNAYIGELDIMHSKRGYQQSIGYCPQYDALIDLLTGREMLYLFARLRGLEEKCIPVVVNQLISDVDLQFHADKVTGCYSGGNKRKLSLAMALVGAPRVVFLDEPSAGVDAANRRRMWTVLSAVRERGCCLVLTSHSMEECETLCSRIAIMVSGEFKCLGSLQHLRHKFGQGFSLYIKIKVDKIMDPDYLVEVRRVVESKLHAELKQHHFVNLFYHIPDKSLKWSYLFETMETIKETYQLENFIISDTSLEQIFLAFSSKQISTD